MPAKKLINFFAQCAKIERSTGYKILALLGGATFFLIVVPAMLIYFGQLLEKVVFISISVTASDAIAFASIIVGLVFIVWTIITQWHVGKGTPVPIAPPKKLVIVGPYKLCRNPMQFGAMLYYLGIGTYFSSLTAGLFSMLAVLVFTLVYSKNVEEKELEIKFGQQYLDYKCKTPFLIPKM